MRRPLPVVPFLNLGGAGHQRDEKEGGVEKGGEGGGCSHSFLGRMKGERREREPVRGVGQEGDPNGRFSVVNWNHDSLREKNLKGEGRGEGGAAPVRAYSSLSLGPSSMQLGKTNKRRSRLKKYPQATEEDLSSLIYALRRAIIHDMGDYQKKEGNPAVAFHQALLRSSPHFT